MPTKRPASRSASKSDLRRAASQLMTPDSRAPTITSASSTSATSVDIEWDPPQQSGNISNYQPAIVWKEGAAWLDKLPPTPTKAILTMPSIVPNDAWIRIAAMSGSSVGAFAESVAFLVDVASGLTVSYDAKTISATWDESNDSRVNAYEVKFTLNDQDSVTELVYTNSWSKAFTPTAGQTASVSVRQVAGFSLSPPCKPVYAILSRPTITGSTFNGSQLELTWTPVTDPAATGYIVSVLSGLQVMDEYTSGGPTASIPFASNIDTIQVHAIGSSTSGPPTFPFKPFTERPIITLIAFDTSGSLRIDWDKVGGATRYKVEFRVGNVVKLTKNINSANSLTLSPSELPSSGIYDVTVQAFGSQANDNMSSPVSAAMPAVVLPPPIIDIEYDGRTARVTWEAIVSPVITGYVTTILNGDNPVSKAITVGPTASIDVAYDAAIKYNVVVQANTSCGQGQPSPPGALFQSGWYPSTATNAAAHIIPASLAGMSNYDIVVYLPNIFTTYVATGLPSAPPFVFSTTDPPYSYKLTMPANSAVWNFNADAIRADIVTAYQTLLATLVQLKVTPLGWRMVQDAISRAMPQTFAESLFYAYAFVPGDGYIDLKPGMLLRADFESYQYLGPTQTISKFVDGFVSTSSAVYDIGSYVTANNQWLTGFDSFLSLVTQTGSTVPPPQTEGSTSSGGGGIIDLYYSQFRKPYVRLVYPPEILNDRTAEARTPFNVAVLAANDYQTLENATQNLRNAQPLSSEVAATYMRGRTMISACIRVWLDGQAQVVPVGASVGNLLESMGRRPPIVIPQSGNPGIPIDGLVVHRSIGYAVTDPNDYSTSKGIPIRLDWDKGMAYSATTDWLSLPLLPGDHITTRGN